MASMSQIATSRWRYGLKKGKGTAEEDEKLKEGSEPNLHRLRQYFEVPDSSSCARE
jgi:hypothetical protein